MNKHGGDIYGENRIVHDFSVNLSPLGMPPGVRDALKEAVMRSEAYPDVIQRRLRKAIGESLGLNWAKVVCGNGAADLIYRIAQAVKEVKGDAGRTLILGPAFSEYEKAATEAGFSVEYHLPEREEGFIPGEEFLKEIEEKRPHLVFVCNPGNPTGALLDREYVNSLILECEKSKAYLVLDECFLELTERGCEDSPLSMGEGRFQPERLPHLLVLRSFTKTYAMAGIRLGYCICGDEEFAEGLMEVGQPWKVSSVAEEAGLAALRQEEYVAEAREYISRERIRMEERLAGMGLDVLKGSANYIFFRGPLGLDEKLVESGVLIRNCSNYFGLKSGDYRIAVKSEEENGFLMREIESLLTGEAEK